MISRGDPIINGVAAISLLLGVGTLGATVLTAVSSSDYATHAKTRVLNDGKIKIQDGTDVHRILRRSSYNPKTRQDEMIYEITVPTEGLLILSSSVEGGLAEGEQFIEANCSIQAKQDLPRQGKAQKEGYFVSPANCLERAF